MRQRLRRHWLILPLALVAATSSLALSHRWFPDGSPNHDELAYLSQAEAIRAGELTLPRSTHDPSFRPFLSGLREDRIVFKYQPGWPAFLAAVRAGTGSYRPALGLTAAGAVVAVYGFAWELSRRRRVTAIAAASFCVSPFTIVQSATYLPYLPSLALLALASACVLRGLRTDRRALLVAGGAALELAFFHRSFDAAIWSLPLVAHVWRCLRPGRRLATFGALSLGALPFGLAYLAYNGVVTGDPLRPAFTVTTSLDAFGFGRRASFVVGDPSHAFDYRPGDAVVTIWHFSAALPAWTFGWLFGLALAILGACSTRRRDGTSMLVATVVAFPAGYAFWWGTANAVAFHLPDALGPFYWFPILGPVAVLFAYGCDALANRPRPLLAVVGMLLVGATSASLLGVRPVVHGAGTAQTELARRQRAPLDQRSLVVVDPPFPGYPYVNAVVPADLGRARRLVALAGEGPGDRLALAERYPHRSLWFARRLKPPGRPFAPSVASLVHGTVIEGEAIWIEARTRVALRAPYVSIDGHLQPTASHPVQLTARDLGPGPHVVAIGAELLGERVEIRWEMRTTSTGRVRALLPGWPWRLHRYPRHRAVWVREDLTPIIGATVRTTP